MSRLLASLRARYGVVAVDAASHRELDESGWDEVLTNASKFYWRIWLGPPMDRLRWYQEIKLHGMPEGSLAELVEHVLRPVRWNQRLAIWHYPRRSRGGRGLIVKRDSGWEVIG